MNVPLLPVPSHIPGPQAASIVGAADEGTSTTSGTSIEKMGIFVSGENQKLR